MIKSFILEGSWGGGGTIGGSIAATQIAFWTWVNTIGGSANLTFNSWTNIISTVWLNLSWLTASEILGTDGSKNLISLAVATYPSLTELSYVKGATSSIQAQINAIISGIQWKTLVVAATTVAGTLASDFENGDTIDGVVLATGDRILIKNQVDQTENWIRIVAASGAPARSTDADTWPKLVSAAVSVQSGTTNAGRWYIQTTPWPITIGVSNIIWAQFLNNTYVGTLNRISITGNVIDIASTYVGQNSITVVGTIGTGTWNATIISLAKWGTGSALSDPGVNSVQVWDDTTNTIRLAALSWLSYNSGTNVLTASGMWGVVVSVVGSTSIGVNSTDPANPIVSRAALTGEVTASANSNAMTLDKTAISNRSIAALASNDIILFGKTSNSNALIKNTISSLNTIMIRSQASTWMNFFTDFLFSQGNSNVDNSMPIAVSGAGSSALQIVNTFIGRAGILELSTGSTGTGAARTTNSNVTLGQILVGWGTIYLETDIYLPAISTVTQEYAIVCGFFDTTALSKTNSIRFLYDRAGSTAGSSPSPNWQIVCSNAGTNTFTTTIITAAAATWFKLGILINAGGTSVDYFINGTNIGTIATNIPTVAMGFGNQIIKSVGGTPSLLDIDYYLVNEEFTTPR